ncbi:MAG: BNR-4 repeat-containing protein [Planctomycetota bacterium]
MTDPSAQADFCRVADGFHGMWHRQPDAGGKGAKYSGGLSTYPAQQGPQAVFVADANKTFFCWGGVSPDNYLRLRSGERRWDFQSGNLLQCVGAFDHTSGRLLPPVCVFDKWCADPHDNPVIQVDRDGYLWLFSPSHGDWTTRSFIHRSVAPHDHTAWETVSDGPLFAYPHVHYRPQHGFCFVHTVYDNNCRGLHVRTSDDGMSWTPTRAIAMAGQGHYAVSCLDAQRGVIHLAFDYHPEIGGLDRRTNLYILRSSDWGATWTTSSGEQIDLPITSPDHPARVLDTEEQRSLCYVKDAALDLEGRLLLLVSTAPDDGSPPGERPSTWKLIRERETGWTVAEICVSDHDYDYGSLYVERVGATERLRIIGATEPGPQPRHTGGHLATWISDDGGQSWHRERVLTRGGSVNHTYPRKPLGADPAFYAFWADGDASQPSASSLWYIARDAAVPTRMEII